MKNVKDRIAEITTKGYELDFGTVFENAFENYKKIAVYAGSMLLIFTFLFIILLFGIAIAVFGVGALSEFIKPGNLKPETFTGDFLLIYTACVILITCLLSPFQAGFLKMADCGQKGEEFHVSTIFEYYKPPYFINIVFATFTITLFSTGLSTLAEQAGMPFIGIITSLAITFLTFITIPLIVFGNLNATEAIKSSITIILKQPLVILGLIIVAFIASLTGLIAFCIGIFFTMPFLYSMEYVLYDSIIGIDSVSEIDELGSNV
ncbi:hypothetical protein SAMN05443549_105268 [Flavobacterium fluvii]|uniref:DUF4013 domain-containing protein n=1 Tax=Flavobacterium fluvii TaxID=468056 RepID=A0A1M5LNK6_9FLAO|nr:hypothetical protein [Flavobacterium fluvii]SHG66239.1 hypothetical protein SAMN05443549_105268 [Flavobacterium fluvii]